MIGNEAVLSMIGGDLERAARASEGALAAHLESSDFDALADTGLIRAQIALAQVDMDTAWKRLLEAEKLVHASGARYDMVHAGLTRAWLLRHEGDLAGALSALREVRVQGWSSRAMEAAVMSESARVQRKLGRLADAEADARAALDALAEIDGSEWGIQTFEAVLEALDSVPRDVRTSAAQRAALYVESMRGKVGETWRAAFDRRADVQKLKELASS
jgi:tetratricopeptide (TPR) repeat protein